MRRGDASIGLSPSRGFLPSGGGGAVRFGRHVRGRRLLDLSRDFCGSAVIRHPGYLAGIFIIAASGVGLGSWLATTMLVIATLPFLFYRAITEDRILQVRLPGYRDYAKHVRWRLIPGIW